VDYPDVGRNIIIFSIVSAVGQLFIFYSLLVFDSLVCTTITTIRKFMTIVISVAFHGNVLSLVQWLSVAMVFGAIVFDTSGSKLTKSRSPRRQSDPMRARSPAVATAV
jgi:UDP-galactose transporter B1